MLTDLCVNWTPGDITVKITDLKKFYGLYILEKPKEGMNEIKRELYKKIKNAPDAKIRQQWYDLYQTIKET